MYLPKEQWQIQCRGDDRQDIVESPAILGWVSLSSAALVEIVKKDSETESKKKGREEREPRKTNRENLILCAWL